MSLRFSEKDVARFYSRLAPADNRGCRRFIGYQSRGYGQFSIGARRSDGIVIYAHRFAWIIVNGPIPEGLKVLHECDVSDCCNIEHLFMGTPRDNTQDMIAKGRWNGGYARKLSNSDHNLMIALRHDGWLLKDLSALFDLTQSRISQLLKEGIRI